MCADRAKSHFSRSHIGSHPSPEEGIQHAWHARADGVWKPLNRCISIRCSVNSNWRWEC
jgi:hypothetical protein